MSCKNVCRLCRSLVLSEAIAFDPTTNSLDITLPDTTTTTGVGYLNGCKVCIVVAQSIPDSTTINALVNIVIGGTRFPLVQCNCSQVTACQIKSRTRYATRVVTDTVSGSFRLLSNLCCTKPDNLRALPITPTTDGGGA